MSHFVLFRKRRGLTLMQLLVLLALLLFLLGFLLAATARVRNTAERTVSQNNLRQIILFYRECLEMLQAAGAEHKNALVVNTSSIAGKRGEGWLSVYAAAKHGVVGWTQSMIKELSPHGIKSTALCPAFVDTPMTDFVKEHVSPDEMIRPEDIAESVRFLLRTTPACVVPEIMFVRPGDAL